MDKNFITDLRNFLEGFLDLKYIENTRIGKRCIYCGTILENNNNHSKNCLRNRAKFLLKDLNKQD